MLFMVHRTKEFCFLTPTNSSDAITVPFTFIFKNIMTGSLRKRNN